jgi:ferritin-like metal-binding protein YciE
MAVNYKAYLNQRDRDRNWVEHLESNERDYYWHQRNAARYTALLATLEDGEFKNRITQLLADTNDRIQEVDAIINAMQTETEAPSDDTIAEIVGEIRSERARAKGAN